VEYDYARHCRCCGRSSLERVLDLGRQPLANSYLQKPSPLPTFPLELMVCQDCFHNQLSVVVNPALMFSHYLYVSGTSRTLREHFAGFAREALTWVEPRPHRVLDLACNDGTLLDAFRREGCSVHGVDPAENLVALARSKGLEITHGYWPHARAALPGRFDLITAANVLAHVADPAGFLAAAMDSLTDGGAVVVEFPYCREMIAHCEWDTIYHEHLSYYLVLPLLSLVERVQARVTHARLVPIHGGSLRLAIKPGSGPHCQSVVTLGAAECEAGFQDMTTYQQFAHQVDQNCEELRDLVTTLTAEGRRIIGYGASAKGNTLLNRCPLPLEYIVDDNPLKHGYLTPGQQIPIRHPDAVRSEGDGLHVLLLAWNFAREIVQNLRSWRPGRGDAVIHYVPEVRCHAVDADLALLE
jgi:novobiocin biosynthesis protein NovU/D-mycarose 3-C-methyltransferase